MSAYGEKFQLDMKNFTNFARALGDQEVESAVHGYKLNVIIISIVFLTSIIVIIVSVFFIRENIFRPIHTAKEYFSLIETGDL